MAEKKDNINRRDFFRKTAFGTCAACIGAIAATQGLKAQSPNLVWQTDPEICVSCGNCATYCVLEESAVKCVHAFAMCGYCELFTC